MNILFILNFKTLKKTLIALFLIGFIMPTYAQTWKLFKNNDNLNCQYFTTDPLNNIYVVTNKNEILSYDNTGLFESRYANKKLGRMAYVDATIPFKILLYYPDFQTIMLIDRDLNSLGSINLNDLGVARATTVSMGDDGSIWVFDGGKNVLLKYNFNNGQTSRDIESPIVPFRGHTPVQLVYRSNKLYANVPAKGIYEFDRFGKFVRVLDIKNADNFQVIDNQLLFKKDNSYFNFNLKTLATQSLNLPKGVTGEQAMRMEKKRLFVQRQTSIDIYDQQ